MVENTVEKNLRIIHHYLRRQREVPGASIDSDVFNPETQRVFRAAYDDMRSQVRFTVNGQAKLADAGLIHAISQESISAADLHRLSEGAVEAVAEDIAKRLLPLLEVYCARAEQYNSR